MKLIHQIGPSEHYAWYLYKDGKFGFIDQDFNTGTNCYWMDANEIEYATEFTDGNKNSNKDCAEEFEAVWVKVKINKSLIYSM